VLSDAQIVKNSVNIFFVNLKFLHFGIYFKYFLYLLVAVPKDIMSDFPHLNYESLHIIADCNKLFIQKYQNIIPGQVDKGALTIHPDVPRFYYIFI